MANISHSLTKIKTSVLSEVIEGAAERQSFLFYFRELMVKNLPWMYLQPFFNTEHGNI